MNLLIQGTHGFVVSEKTKAYISKRIEKIYYFKSHISDVSIHITEEKFNFKIDITLNLTKLGSYKFEATDKELYNAIDKVVHKMDVKINREKTKIQDHSKASHDEVVEFFYEHEENKPEPTRVVEINQKPQKLSDAFLLAKDASINFMGFYFLQDGKTEVPVFLRKIDNDVFYLLQMKDNSNYGEFSLKISKNSCEIDKEIRNIPLKKLGLFQAQKDIL
ncbi:MAG TPA: ribosome-associated translation inhibitor RaiA, partial [Spirochaetota bacterium]|nr:ribosome-associated translation inhibitor RaiA [Spirochaetota bacterium]